MCSNINNNTNILTIVKYSFNELKHCPVSTNRGRDDQH